MATGVRGAVGALPRAPGVYRFRDGAGTVLYIGRAVDLRRRVASYWRPLGDRAHLSRMVSRIATVEAVACDSDHEAAWLERNLLEAFLPRWNRTRGGQEVPTYLRLDQRTLTAKHAVHPAPGVRYFGPYLGGAKARLAVAALRRVLPLDYATEHLRGAERTLARLRGVDPTDRGPLAATIAAVLDRDPEAVAAVRDELTHRRETASQDLRFELAARLHAEHEALTWIVAEQKVTTLEPLDLDLHGWSSGLLLRLGIRHGRLCTWTHSRCDKHTALPHLATTPASWKAFTQRNAELAARLTDAAAG